MLAQFMGNLELPTALFLIALCGGLTIVITTTIAKRRSRLEIDNEFILAKIKEANKLKFEMFQQERSWGFEEKKLQQNLITSHSSSTK